MYQEILFDEMVLGALIWTDSYSDEAREYYELGYGGDGFDRES